MKRVNAIIYPFLILVGCILCSYNTLAQCAPDSTAIKAYKNVLALKTDDAFSILSGSDIPSHHYFQHYAHFVKALANDSQEVFEQFISGHNFSYEAIADSDDDNAYCAYYRADMLLQAAIVNYKYGDEWSAAFNLRKAYIIGSRNMDLYPDFLPNYKIMGLLHIMIGSVPENYNWLLSLFGFEGEVVQGIGELSKVANDTHLFSVESTMLLAIANAYILENTPDAVMQIESLYQENEENRLSSYLYSSLLMKNAQSERALQVINKTLISENDPEIQLPIFEYLKAEILFQKGNYSSAISWYEHFIKNQQGLNFIKDSYYKIALSYFLSSDDENAHQYLEMAKSNGKTIAVADQYAAQQLESEYLPNANILRLRYAIDGGYYALAEEIIDASETIEFTNKKNKVEFNYRMARFYHKTNDISQAIALYKLTINSTLSESWYFGPNSALQLGHIYVQQGEIEQAKKYFTLAIEFKNHVYKSSIDAKAKSALKGLPPVE